MDQALEMTFDFFVTKNIFVQSRNRATFPRCSLASDMGYLSRSSSSSSTISSGTHSLEVIEESLSEEEYENEHDDSSSMGESDRASNQSETSKNEFRLLLTSRNCQLINFYRSILAPYLESYWLTVDHLAHFMTIHSKSEEKAPLIVEEAVFLKDLTTHVHQMLQKGQINYGTFVFL